MWWFLIAAVILSIQQAPLLEVEKKNIATLGSPVFTVQSSLSHVALTTPRPTMVGVHWYNQNTNNAMFILRIHSSQRHMLLEPNGIVNICVDHIILSGFYTRCLVHYLTDPELEIKKMFSLVAEKVLMQSQQKQRPVGIFVTTALQPPPFCLISLLFSSSLSAYSNSQPPLTLAPTPL